MKQDKFKLDTFSTSNCLQTCYVIYFISNALPHSPFLGTNKIKTTVDKCSHVTGD